MGARGELFTTEIYLDNRSYFFNVKENRNGDVFLQVVESKNRDGGEGDRHQIAIFADDMQQFLRGLETSLAFIEKDRKTRSRMRAEIMAERAEKAKKVYRMRDDKRDRDDGIKRTGRVHIVSKRHISESEGN